MKVYLIGAGPGDAGLFSIKGAEILSRADVVVYDYLANEDLLSYARADAEVIYVGKKGGDHTLPQGGINALIVEKAKQGKVVARLKGGDPYMFGRGGEEAEAVVEAGLEFEVVPGITSAIAAAAYAGIPLTHRSFVSSVCFATGHEDPNKPETAHDWKALAMGGSTLVFFMGMKNLPEISGKLIQAGMSPDMPAALVHWGTTPRHRSLASTIAALPTDAEKHGFTAPSLIIVGKVVELRDKLGWFERKPLLGKTIIVTRAREQNSGIAAGLKELGANVVQFPTISIKPLDDYKPVYEAVEKLSDYQWVIFTSVNGVKFFWQALDVLGLDARVFGRGQGVKIAAVGKATAEAVEQKGLKPDFVPESYVAESLADGLIKLCGKELSEMRFLLPRAKVAREVLPEELTARGAVVDVLPVYENVPAESGREEALKLLKDGAVDCVSFGSSSTVTNFMSLVPAETLKTRKGLKFACIGPVTADTLKKAGYACDIMPEEHTVDGLVKAIADKMRS